MIVVTGGSGQLGTAFRDLLPKAAFPGRNLVDLTRPHSLPASLERLAPSLLVNCAAYTAVDRAESEPELAMTVNGVAVEALARFAARAGIGMVTFSTDYVFDGETPEPRVESSPTSPINAYGVSKRAGEEAALDVGGQVLVIRTSWLLSGTHRNFLTAILGRARQGEVRVVDDQHGSPTFASDLAASTLAAVQAGATGLLHLAGPTPTTWFGLAVEATRLAGLNPILVTPIPTSDYLTPARRPRYSILASERARALGLAPMPPWRQVLPGVVDRLSRSGLVG